MPGRRKRSTTLHGAVTAFPHDRFASRAGFTVRSLEFGEDDRTSGAVPDLRRCISISGSEPMLAEEDGGMVHAAARNTMMQSLCIASIRPIVAALEIRLAAFKAKFKNQKFLRT